MSIRTIGSEAGKAVPVVVAVLVGSLLLACSRTEQPPEAQQKPQAVSIAAEASAKPATSTATHEPPPGPPAPKSLGPFRIPPANPLTPEKILLGQRLFFDKRLSVDGTLACYDCHKNEDGTGDHHPLAIGPGGNKLSRHAPTLWNIAYLPKLYWDGRVDSLETQFAGAWGGGNMGVGTENLGKKAQEIGELPEYKAQFESLFPDEGATPNTVAQAVASYERTLLCADTAFDRYVLGDDRALTTQQKQGWDLFKGRAMCNACHVPPFFSDAFLSDNGAFHNTGRGTVGKPERQVDMGRMTVTQNPSDWAAFKTPSLRGVTRSAPYFHDGSVTTLREAVRFMAKGGAPNKNLDVRLVDTKLTGAEITSLVSFLASLDCTGKLERPAAH